MSIFYFILAGITSWRITHLIIEDTIAEKPVNFLFKISRYNKYLKSLLTCYYCLGFWVSLTIYIVIALTTSHEVDSFIYHIIYIGALASFPPLIQEFIPEEN